jgi:RHS repeat-associated protein
LEWFSVHTDQLGAPRALSNSAGKMVWRWFSQPFGEGVVNSDVDADGRSVTFNLRFPGQYFDWDTKLHYNYFRNYDVNTGKYIESDPIGLEGGINTYGYSYQNPIMNFDPDGKLAWLGVPAWIWFTTGAGGVGAVIASQHPEIVIDTVRDLSKSENSCPPNDKCAEIEREIKTVAAELRGRYIDALTDRNQLYDKAHISATLGKKKGSWRGHRIQFEEKQVRLKRFILEADIAGCKVDSMDRALSRSPFPDKPANW